MMTMTANVVMATDAAMTKIMTMIMTMTRGTAIGTDERATPCTVDPLHVGQNVTHMVLSGAALSMLMVWMP